MKNIALLGSTGSIGKNTLEVVRNNPDKLRIISLTAGKNWQLLAEQAREFKPKFVALADTKYENDLKQALKAFETVPENPLDDDQEEQPKGKPTNIFNRLKRFFV